MFSVRVTPWLMVNVELSKTENIVQVWLEDMVMEPLATSMYWALMSVTAISRMARIENSLIFFIVFVVLNC